MDKAGNYINTNFSSFLLEKDLLQLILAVYLGTLLQDFFNSLVEGAILPTMFLFVPDSKATRFQDIIFNIRGVNIQFGTIFMNLMNVMIGFLISFMFVKYIIYKYL
jgi:large-conductance mechanosensitive channel